MTDPMEEFFASGHIRWPVVALPPGVTLEKYPDVACPRCGHQYRGGGDGVEGRAGPGHGMSFADKLGAWVRDFQSFHAFRSSGAKKDKSQPGKRQGRPVEMGRHEDRPIDHKSSGEGEHDIPPRFQKFLDRHAAFPFTLRGVADSAGRAPTRLARRIFAFFRNERKVGPMADPFDEITHILTQMRQVVADIEKASDRLIAAERAAEAVKEHA